MPTTIFPRDRLILPLDFSDLRAARAMIARLGDAVSFYKVGMELAYSGEGLAFARELADAGKNVFVDLKLHDIPNTVEHAVRQIARLGARFATVHAYPQTMRAARQGAGDDLKILAVTVLTSSDDADLAQAGYALGVADLVARRAQQARDIGIDGIVLSAQEAAAMRPAVGADLLLVTPGVRPAGSSVGDQKRVMTPQNAIVAGADYLVVGRPILEAPDPTAAAHAIVAEIEAGLVLRGRAAPSP